MKKYHTVYKTTNSITGEFYIGKHSTDDLDDDYLGSGVALRDSIKLYGRDNFTKEIIAICRSDRAALVRESKEVSKVFGTEGCLNKSSDGGSGMSGENNGFYGKQHSDESRQKISESHKGKPLSEEHRRKMSDAWKTRAPASEETRRKMSEAAKNMSEETKQKMSDAQKGEKNHMFGKTGSMFGKAHSTETRQKISDSQKGEKNHMFGKTTPEETRKKLGLKSKLYHAKNRVAKNAYPNYYGHTFESDSEFIEKFTIGNV